MGSGEPFDNYDETIKFLRLVSAPEGINISARNISVSTSGIVPRIRDFANLKLQVNLCISLHAPNDEVRKKIMPVAHKYSVAELIDSAKYFVAQTNRRIIFEYSLIDGVNDSPEQAKELAKLVKGFQSHINLINLNPLPPELVREVNGFELKPPTKERAMQFMDAVIKNGASCTMRKNRGSDIDGACGQLSLKNS
jgi:23S rRNA (adenine2503-C2)-methyltransferase